MKRFTHEQVLEKFLEIKQELKDTLYKVKEYTCEVNAFGVENDSTPPIMWMHQDIEKTMELLSSQIFNLEMTLHSRKKNV